MTSRQSLEHRFALLVMIATYELYPEIFGEQFIYPNIIRPKNPEHGRASYCCSPLAKGLKRDPKEIAKEILEKIKSYKVRVEVL